MSHEKSPRVEATPTFEDVFRLQESLHTSEKLLTLISTETVEDDGQRQLLCVVTAMALSANNVPGIGGGSSTTVEYHNVSALPGWILQTLSELRDLFTAMDA